MNITCEHCHSVLSSKYVLKNHLSTNKACLAIRNTEPVKKFNCKACPYVATDNQKIVTHQDTCKSFQIMVTKEELTKIHLQDMKELKQVYKIQQNELQKKEMIILDLQQKVEELKDFKIKHDELKIRYDELSKQHEKTIDKLELKISQCDTFIQNLAREASNKPTTTNNNNTINNSIRNHLSPTFTIDKLEDKKLEETMREHYTEFDYFCGQRGLATFLVERVIRTPDEKMMICCTDTSRKKFKILDMNGNLKEDIQARVLCEKIKEPTSIVTKEMYEKITNRIDEERKRLSDNDQSRKSKLVDDSMRAQQYYIDNMNFDDINYNGDFIKELCVLLNV